MEVSGESILNLKTGSAFHLPRQFHEFVSRFGTPSSAACSRPRPPQSYRHPLPPRNEDWHLIASISSDSFVSPRADGYSRAQTMWVFTRKAVVCADYSNLQRLQHVGRGICVRHLRRRRLRAETRAQPAVKKSFVCKAYRYRLSRS